MVLTLPSLFLITVIFIFAPNKRLWREWLPELAGLDRGIVEDPGARRHRLDLAAALLDDRDFHEFAPIGAPCRRACFRELAGLDRGIVEDPGTGRHRLDLAGALLDDRDFHNSLLSG